MPHPAHAPLNEFLVGAFNGILRTEGRTLCTGQYRDLTMREFHVIEAVCQAEKRGDCRSRAVASSLGITAGSLTTAVGPLIKKGYLERRADPADKRAVLLLSTEKGQAADSCHAAFHHDMVSAVIDRLQPDELGVLVKALAAVQDYFAAPTFRKED